MKRCAYTSARIMVTSTLFYYCLFSKVENVRLNFYYNILQFTDRGRIGLGYNIAYFRLNTRVSETNAKIALKVIIPQNS